MKTRKRAAIAAAGAALALGASITVTGVSPLAQAQNAQPTVASSASGPFRIHSYADGGNKQTPIMWSNHSAQICYNAWGSHLKDGYNLYLHASSGIKWKSPNYYGPKHKTCSPWKYFRGNFTGMVLARPGGGASVYADVWLYYS